MQSGMFFVALKRAISGRERPLFSRSIFRIAINRRHIKVVYCSRVKFAALIKRHDNRRGANQARYALIIHTSTTKSPKASVESNASSHVCFHFRRGFKSLQSRMM